jgi:hypothetical protein
MKRHMAKVRSPDRVAYRGQTVQQRQRVWEANGMRSLGASRDRLI